MPSPGATDPEIRSATRPAAATPQSLIAEILPFLRKRGFEAGDRLPSERELAERFSVSRSSMREALVALEAIRLIERRPQSGIFLRSSTRDASLDALVLESGLGIPMTASEVAELNEFRAIMEMQAVALACSRHEPEDLALMDEVLADSERNLAKGESLADQDAQFHLAIYAAAHNQFLLRAANSFYLASRTRRDQYFADEVNSRRSYAEHRRMREAIAARDVPKATALLGRHLGSVERYWLSTLLEDEVGNAPAAKPSPGARAGSRGSTR